MFLSAKGLHIFSKAELSQESKNVSLTNTAVAVFSEIEVEVGYRLKKTSIFYVAS